ncbi:MAG: UDP-N-acetylglucosamine 1-carboxyvinyltransferase [Armatimonadota bacterium]
MAKYVIDGGTPLRGEITASGAKNAALPIMAASILVSGKVYLSNVPDISDVRVMVQLLKKLGADITFEGSGEVFIDSSAMTETPAPYELVKKIHASFDITGPLLARFNRAEVPLPGGCVIGSRAVDLHIHGFEKLGAKVSLEHGILDARARGLTGNKIYFARSSVGATKNVMMAACMAKGETLIDNAACEPEVNDLAHFLNKCGARIKGIGTKELIIDGVSRLHGAEYEIIPDRIEAGTYLFAAAKTKGDILINKVNPNHLKAVLEVLERTGIDTKTTSDTIQLKALKNYNAVEIATEPYPGFPTDLQPPLVAMLTTAKGVSFVEETIFNGRFGYVDELRRMGADIIIRNRGAVVRGVKTLTGAPVEAGDLRAGGALVAAALAAEGRSEVFGVEYIERGYEKFEDKITSLGGNIKRAE